jgi:hypothetical protein
MQIVENVDRCIYRTQISEQSQMIIEELATLWGVETTVIFSMMLTFAEHMAVSRIINAIAENRKKE